MWLFDVFVYLNIRLYLILIYKNFIMLQGCFLKYYVILYMSEICERVIDIFFKLLWIVDLNLVISIYNV